MIRRALAAGHQPVSFLMSEKWADDLADVLRAHPDTPAYVGSEEQLEQVTGFHLHRGALVSDGSVPAPQPLEQLLQGASRVAIWKILWPHECGRDFPFGCRVERGCCAGDSAVR